MRNLKNDESSSSNRFIPNADRIREKINQANRDGKWRGQMPIGPLGDFMKLKPGFDKFIGTAEYLIGSYLRYCLCFWVLTLQWTTEIRHYFGTYYKFA